MSEAHTPGLWNQKHRAGSDGMYRTEIYSEEFGGIATCEWTPENFGNGVIGTYREANARLIAAAPDLLEALVALVNHKDDLMPSRLWDAARAAIARADGVQRDN